MISRERTAAVKCIDWKSKTSLSETCSELRALWPRNGWSRAVKWKSLSLSFRMWREHLSCLSRWAQQLTREWRSREIEKRTNRRVWQVSSENNEFSGFNSGEYLQGFSSVTLMRFKLKLSNWKIQNPSLLSFERLTVVPFHIKHHDAPPQHDPPI